MTTFNRFLNGEKNGLKTLRVNGPSVSEDIQNPTNGRTDKTENMVKCLAYKWLFCNTPVSVKSSIPYSCFNQLSSSFNIVQIHTVIETVFKKYQIS